MADIFISYATEDRPKAKLLAAVFVARGWSVWWDRVIPPGKSFDDVIEHELREAKSVVVCWSRSAIQSIWVKSEADEALTRGVLIPVLFEDVRPPMPFRRMQSADLINWTPDSTSEHFHELLRAVESLAGRSKGNEERHHSVIAGPRTDVPEATRHAVQERSRARLERTSVDHKAEDATPNEQERSRAGPKVLRNVLLAEDAEESRARQRVANSDAPRNDHSRPLWPVLVGALLGVVAYGWGSTSPLAPLLGVFVGGGLVAAMMSTYRSFRERRHEVRNLGSVQHPPRYLSLIHLSGARRGQIDEPSLPAGIGTRSDLAVVVPGTAERHALLFERLGEVIVKDEGSGLGISVGGEAVEEAVLRDGDVLELGPAGPKLRFRNHGPN